MCQCVIHTKSLGSVTAYVKMYKAFCGSRESCLKCAKLPQVMFVGAEDYMFIKRNESGSVELERSEVTTPL